MQRMRGLAIRYLPFAAASSGAALRGEAEHKRPRTILHLKRFNSKRNGSYYDLRAGSELRKDNTLLRLVLPLAVGIARLAHLIRLKKEDLAQALIGIHARRQRRGIGDFQRHESLPFGLERRD